jgi:hypothetical protein
MNNQKIIISGVLFSILITPALTFAEGRDVKTKIRLDRNNGSNFCTMITKNQGDFVNHFDERLLTLKQRRDDRALQVTQRRGDRDEKRTDHRETKEENFSERYAKLDEMATTDAQKAAVAQFKTSINQAISARTTAINTAVTSFRNGIDQIRTSRKTMADSLIATLKSTKDAAFAKAQSDCASNVDPKTAKATFEASVTAAHNAFVAGRKALDAKSDINTLTEARKSALQAALNTFKTNVEAARTQLKTAFPNL